MHNKNIVNALRFDLVSGRGALLTDAGRVSVDDHYCDDLEPEEEVRFWAGYVLALQHTHVRQSVSSCLVHVEGLRRRR